MRKLITAVLAAVVLSCASCASIQDVVQRSPAVSTLAVQYATAKVIEAGKTDEARLQRAARIKAIASDAKTWLSGDAVTIDFLQQAAAEQIGKLDLGPADRTLALGLVGVIVQELQAKVGAGVIPPDKVVTVNQVLAWVIAAAEAYGA